jgi:hypothetical protein
MLSFLLRAPVSPSPEGKCRTDASEDSALDRRVPRAASRRLSPKVSALAHLCLLRTRRVSLSAGRRLRSRVSWRINRVRGVSSHDLGPKPTGL